MKPKDPNVCPTAVSARADLDEFMHGVGVNQLDDGVCLSAENTRQLSAHLKCISQKFVEKFLPSDGSKEELTCFAGKILWNNIESYAYVWTRIDHLCVDIDYALLTCDTNGSVGKEISAVYEPTFVGRTSKTESVSAQIQSCTGKFKISDLSTSAPVLYNAFNHCETFCPPSK